MNIPSVFWIVPFASVCALIMAFYFYKSMMREDEGTERMREVAGYVRTGAMAYLRQQYKVVIIIFVVISLIFAFMSYVLHVQNPWVPFAFITGGADLMERSKLKLNVHEDSYICIGAYCKCS